MNISSIGASGMMRATDRFEASATRIARTGTGLETGDLAESIIDMKTAQIDFEANVKVVKMANDMVKTTLDMLV
nr:flagellar basal body rod C-terminal domain-containing protein [uncultured Devosia sp.]